MPEIDNSKIQRNMKVGDDYIEYGTIKMLRATFPKLIAKELLSIQPMSTSISLKDCFPSSEERFLENLKDFILEEDFNV